MNAVFRLNQPKIAFLAVGISLGALFLCICACVNSPVSWSPDGSKIAIMVSAPVKEDPNQFAIFIYDFNTDQRVLIDKVENNGILSAPAWSGDGKWIGYLKADSFGTGEALFSEDKSYLSQFQPEIDKVFDANEEHDTFNVKLIIATPDGKDRKVLKNLNSPGDSKDMCELWAMQPTWSKNSKELFYSRRISSQSFYLASITIDSGKTTAYVPSEAMPLLSPDGKKILAYEGEQDNMISFLIANTKGKKINHFTMDSKEAGFPFLWMPDSKHLLCTTEKSLLTLNIYTAAVEKLIDVKLQPKTGSSDMVLYPRFSPKGDTLYYFAIEKSIDPNRDNSVWLNSMNIKNKQIVPVYELSEIPGNTASFFISPDCKTVLARAIVDDENKDDKSAFVVWDGKSRKIIETDPWLEEAFKEK